MFFSQLGAALVMHLEGTLVVFQLFSLTLSVFFSIFEYEIWIILTWAADDFWILPDLLLTHQV